LQKAEGVERPVAVVIVRSGSEFRVGRDLLDALYPHDPKVRVSILRGALALYTELRPEELRTLLSRYPIRGLLKIRILEEVVCSHDTTSAVEALLEKLAAKGLKLSHIEVRTRGTVARRHASSIVLEAAKRLGVLSSCGIKGRIEFLGDCIGFYRLSSSC